MFDNIPVWLTFTLGFSAQTFFGLRTALQWLKSEMAHESVSPVSYWIFSVIGACLMFIYGVLRNDFSIILGQFVAYFIYLWNLNANGIWDRMKILTRVLLAALPFVAAMLLFKDAPGIFTELLPQQRHSGVACGVRLNRSIDVHAAVRLSVCLLTPLAYIRASDGILDHQHRRFRDDHHLRHHQA